MVLPVIDLHLLANRVLYVIRDDSKLNSPVVTSRDYKLFNFNSIDAPHYFAMIADMVIIVSFNCLIHFGYYLLAVDVVPCFAIILHFVVEVDPFCYLNFLAANVSR